MRSQPSGTLIASTVVMVMAASAPCCQDFPTRPVRIITGEAGGAVDLTSRLIAQGISRPLGQQVIVDNRGGGGGAVAIIAVAKAPSDGYTVLAYSSAVWIVPLLQDRPLWDALKDFSPVTLATRSPSVLVVHPSVPARSVKELIALARARPGALNYASVGPGSQPHLAAELFKAMAGINIVHVAYKGTAPGVTDLLSGQVQLMFTTMSAVMPQVKAGRLRAMAVTSAQASALVTGLPTVAASGLPGYECIQTLGVYAPAATPKRTIDRLNHEMVQTLNSTDVKEKLLSAGLEVTAGSPEQHAVTMKSEIVRMGKVIKDVGIRAD